MSPVVLAMNGAQRDQVIQELYDAALTAGDAPMATVGAYKLLSEWDGDLHDERFLALRDAYLNLMREMRFSSGHLTGYEAERWIELHGDLATALTASRMLRCRRGNRRRRRRTFSRARTDGLR